MLVDIGAVFRVSVDLARLVPDALVEAAEALEEAIAGRIDDGRDIPEPTARSAANAR
jgi:hypothetical protein